MSTQTVAYAPEMPIWARLHMARFLAGMEVRELTAATGISRNTIANYESAAWDRKRNPAYIRLWALATGVDYQWLSEGVPTPGDGLDHEHRGNGPSTGFAEIVPIHSAARFRPAA